VDQIDLVGVSDPEEQRAEAVAQRFRVQNHYTDYEEMIAQLAPEAVFVCGAPNWQAEVAERVLQIGRCALFIDSPAVQQLEQIEALCAAQKQAGVQVQVGTTLRWAPAHQATRKIIRDESFGSPMLIEVRYASTELGQSHLAAANRLERFLLDHAVPLIDYMCHVMGDLIRVDARTCWREAALALGITVEFASDAIGYVAMTSSAPAFELSVMVAGEARSSVETYQARRIRLQTPRQQADLPDEAGQWLATHQFETGLTGPQGAGLPGEREQMEAFARNLLAERPVQPNLRQHRDVLRVVDAIRKSSKTGQPIRMRTTSFPLQRAEARPAQPGDSGAKGESDGNAKGKSRRSTTRNPGNSRRPRKTEPMPVPPRTGRPAQRLPSSADDD
jgi:predicted dehydrogenase